MRINEKTIAAIYILIAITITLFAFKETVSDFLVLWMQDNNPTYSHGLLLAVVCALIILREWRRMHRIEIRPQILPVLALFLCSLLWLLAALGTIQIIQMLVLIMILSLLFWALMGFRQARPFFFPVFLMLGATPIWEVLGYPLQYLTAVVVGQLARFTIIPSIRDDMHILIPAGTFEVAPGCSGLNYFITAVIIATLFVYLNNIRWERAGLYIATAMLASIIANIIRVYVIVLSGQLTNMQSYFVTVEHVSLGWAVFAVCITLYLWVVGRGLEKNQREDGDHRQRNEVEERSVERVSYYKTGGLFIILIAAVFFGPLMDAYYQAKYKDIPVIVSIIPEQAGGWRKAKLLDDYQPAFGHGIQMVETAYVDLANGQTIYVYMNYYYTQTQGDEAVSDQHHIDNEHWQTWSKEIIAINLDGFKDVLETVLVAPNGRQKLVWQWYETSDMRTGRKQLAKFENIIGIIKGDPSINVMLIAIDVNNGIQAARADLQRFLGQARDKIRIERL